MPIMVSKPASGVNAFAHRLRQLQHLGQRQQSDRKHGARQNLDDHLRREQPGMDHEIEAAERFVRLVDAVDEVQHLEAEVDDEGVEQVCATVSTQRMSIGTRRSQFRNM